MLKDTPGLVRKRISPYRLPAEKSTRSWIDKGPRLLKKPSDHTPIIAEFDIS
jgi:hypothetical protein